MTTDGGAPARRAVVRWALRLLRREWRQQVVVLGLLTLAVAAAVGFGTTVVVTAGVGDGAAFGSANHRYQLDEPDLDDLEAAVAAARERFGAVDLLVERDVALPGSVSSLVYRSLDPSGSFIEPMLGLLAGRHPVEPDEVAVTDGVADALQVDLGGLVDLDGRPRRVVGTVEDPSDLSDEFLLVAPSGLDVIDRAALLLGGDGSFAEVRDIRAFADQHLPEAALLTRGDVWRGQAGAIVLGAAELVLILVSLVASAGFFALAQRRLRQLGVLAAVGASERHLRLVVVSNGVAIGAVAAVAGALLGAAGWWVAAPRLEHAVGFRIDAGAMPWWLVAGAMVAAVATATAAAWWPARIVARVPVTDALAQRPPVAAPVHRSAASALVLVACGGGVLATSRDNVVTGVGVVLAVAGVLLLSPIVLHWLGRGAGRLPVTVRLALRDLARYRTRSGAALAAVSLALGLPVAVVLSAEAAEASEGFANLPADQLLVWTRHERDPEGVSPFYTADPADSGFAPYLPDLDADDLARAEAAVAEMAEVVGAVVRPLEVAVDERVDDDPLGTRGVTVARETDVGYLDVALVHVATPPLLELYGLPVDDLPHGAVLSTGPVGPAELVHEGSALWLANTADRPSVLTDVVRLEAQHPSWPGTFVSAATARANGWRAVTVGWLLVADAPIDAVAVAAARDVAVDAGLLIEPHESEASLVALKWGATVVGVAVAMAVLAMTVGVIRAGAAREVRVLVATGATSRTRRGVTASTAGGLAAAGALLGTAGAYLVLGTGFVDRPSDLTGVPVAHLSVVLLGVPVLAATGAWLAARREPDCLAQAAVD